MARIIENEEGKRRLIKMSSDDVISIIREYQAHVKNRSSYEEIRNQLEDCIIFIPGEVWYQPFRPNFLKNVDIKKNIIIIKI